MITNKIESWAMKHPVRRWLLRRIEFPRFERAIGKYLAQKPVKSLEIGCGAGFTSELLSRSFDFESMDSIDLDPDMVLTAKKRNKEAAISFSEGNATELTFGDMHFDVVFEFGIFHHIPDWKKSIEEVYRVLKPGGLFMLEDLHIGSFYGTPLRAFLRGITDHPYGEMFTFEAFRDELEKVGFIILEQEKKPWQLDHFFFVLQK